MLNNSTSWWGKFLLNHAFTSIESSSAWIRKAEGGVADSFLQSIIWILIWSHQLQQNRITQGSRNFLSASKCWSVLFYVFYDTVNSTQNFNSSWLLFAISILEIYNIISSFLGMEGFGKTFWHSFGRCVRYFRIHYSARYDFVFDLL